MVLENEFEFRKGDKYYFWDLASRGRATTHPMKDWGGVPSNVSSAIQMANVNYYFFKGDSYWRLNKKRPWDAGPSRSWGGRVSRRFENEYG